MVFFPRERSLKSEDNYIPLQFLLTLEARIIEIHMITPNDNVKARLTTKGRQRKERAKIHKPIDDF